VDALGAAGFHQRRNVEPLKGLADQQRDLTNPIEIRARHRIQIEMHVVRPVHVVAAGVPLVQVDAAQVHEPQQRSEVLDHREVDDVSAFVLDGTDIDPVGPRRRRPFHKKEFAGRAVRIALHDHGAVLDVRQYKRHDVRVVLQHVALRDAQLRPEWFLEIGQPHRSTADRQFEIFGVDRNRHALLRRRAARSGSFAHRRMFAARGHFRVGPFRRGFSL
jgi:hypothetical protein